MDSDSLFSYSCSFSPVQNLKVKFRDQVNKLDTSFKLMNDMIIIFFFFTYIDWLYLAIIILKHFHWLILVFTIIMNILSNKKKKLVIVQKAFPHI